MPLNRICWLGVAVAALVLGVLEVSSALGESQSWDEGIHISSGYAYVTRGDYSWNKEHPPLAKIMSALPLTFLHPDLPIGLDGWKKHDAAQFGTDFLYTNRVPADTILMATRGMTILLTLLFAGALAWWTGRRFGPLAALLAVVLCAFDPNLIAHGRYVSTDVPVTVFYFFACVLWVEYLESGRFRDLAAASAVFALAMVTKFSAVLLIPTLAALYAARWAQRPKEFSWGRLAAAAGTPAAALLVMVGVVYWPVTLLCLAGKAAPLAALVDRGSPAGNLLFHTGRWLHLPAHTYLLGLGLVASHNAGGHSSYLLGLRSETGWWYYFPVVFAVKSTMAALAAATSLAIAGAWLAWKRLPQGVVRQLRAVPPVWAGLLFPPVFYFAVSMTSGIDIGVRHILPVYPFLYVATAAWLAGLSGRPLARYAMISLGLLQIVECARIAPDYLAFFNALSGGPANGPTYVLDSNIDWGQDLKKLAKWLDRHGTHRVRISYFGLAPARYYGVDEVPFPAPLDQNGWDAIDDFAVANVTPLHGVYEPLADLAPLRLREPVAKIGWSMYVYDLRKPKPH